MHQTNNKRIFTPYQLGKEDVIIICISTHSCGKLVLAHCQTPSIEACRLVKCNGHTDSKSWPLQGGTNAPGSV